MFAPLLPRVSETTTASVVRDDAASSIASAAPPMPTRLHQFHAAAQARLAAVAALSAAASADADTDLWEARQVRAGGRPLTVAASNRPSKHHESVSVGGVDVSCAARARHVDPTAPAASNMRQAPTLAVCEPSKEDAFLRLVQSTHPTWFSQGLGRHMESSQMGGDPLGGAGAAVTRPRVDPSSPRTPKAPRSATAATASGATPRVDAPVAADKMNAFSDHKVDGPRAESTPAAATPSATTTNMTHRSDLTDATFMSRGSLADDATVVGGDGSSSRAGVRVARTAAGNRAVTGHTAAGASGKEQDGDLALGADKEVDFGVKMAEAERRMQEALAAHRALNASLRAADDLDRLHQQRRIAEAMRARALRSEAQMAQQQQQAHASYHDVAIASEVTQSGAMLISRPAHGPIEQPFHYHHAQSQRPSSAGPLSHGESGAAKAAALAERQRAVAALHAADGKPYRIMVQRPVEPKSAPLTSERRLRSASQAQTYTSVATSRDTAWREASSDATPPGDARSAAQSMDWGEAGSLQRRRLSMSQSRRPDSRASGSTSMWATAARVDSARGGGADSVAYSQEFEGTVMDDVADSSTLTTRTSTTESSRRRRPSGRGHPRRVPNANRSFATTVVSESMYDNRTRSEHSSSGSRGTWSESQRRDVTYTDDLTSRTSETRSSSADVVLRESDLRALPELVTQLRDLFAAFRGGADAARAAGSHYASRGGRGRGRGAGRLTTAVGAAPEREGTAPQVGGPALPHEGAVALAPFTRATRAKALAPLRATLKQLTEAKRQLRELEAQRLAAEARKQQAALTRKTQKVRAAAARMRRGGHGVGLAQALRHEGLPEDEVEWDDEDALRTALVEEGVVAEDEDDMWATASPARSGRKKKRGGGDSDGSMWDDDGESGSDDMWAAADDGAIDDYADEADEMEDLVDELEDEEADMWGDEDAELDWDEDAEGEWEEGEELGDNVAWGAANKPRARGGDEDYDDDLEWEQEGGGTEQKARRGSRGSSSTASLSSKGRRRRHHNSDTSSYSSVVDEAAATRAASPVSHDASPRHRDSMDRETSTTSSASLRSQPADGPVAATRHAGSRSSSSRSVRTASSLRTASSARHTRTQSDARAGGLADGGGHGQANRAGRAARSVSTGSLRSYSTLSSSRRSPSGTASSAAGVGTRRGRHGAAARGGSSSRSSSLDSRSRRAPSSHSSLEEARRDPRVPPSSTVLAPYDPAANRRLRPGRDPQERAAARDAQRAAAGAAIAAAARASLAVAAGQFKQDARMLHERAARERPAPPSAGDVDGYDDDAFESASVGSVAGSLTSSTTAATAHIPNKQAMRMHSAARNAPNGDDNDDDDGVESKAPSSYVDSDVESTTTTDSSSTGDAAPDTGRRRVSTRRATVGTFLSGDSFRPSRHSEMGGRAAVPHRRAKIWENPPLSYWERRLLLAEKAFESHESSDDTGVGQMLSYGGSAARRGHVTEGKPNGGPVLELDARTATPSVDVAPVALQFGAFRDSRAPVATPATPAAASTGRHLPSAEVEPTSVSVNPIMGELPATNLASANAESKTQEGAVSDTDGVVLSPNHPMVWDQSELKGVAATSFGAFVQPPWRDAQNAIIRGAVDASTTQPPGTTDSRRVAAAAYAEATTAMADDSSTDGDDDGRGVDVNPEPSKEVGAIAGPVTSSRVADRLGGAFLAVSLLGAAADATLDDPFANLDRKLAAFRAGTAEVLRRAHAARTGLGLHSESRAADCHGFGFADSSDDSIGDSDSQSWTDDTSTTEADLSSNGGDSDSD